MSFFKKKEKYNKKHLDFVQDVVTGKKTNIVEIAMFLQQNGKLDVDKETYDTFADVIHKLQNIESKNYERPDVSDYISGFTTKTENGYVGTFVVVGVGYENRQDIIEHVKKRMPLGLNFTKFEGAPAIEVLYENQIIGYIPKEDIPDILEVKKHILSIEVDSTYTKKNGEKGVYAKILISLMANE